jgi:hypothetical protein
MNIVDIIDTVSTQFSDYLQFYIQLLRKLDTRINTKEYMILMSSALRLVEMQLVSSGNDHVNQFNMLFKSICHVMKLVPTNEWNATSYSKFNCLILHSCILIIIIFYCSVFYYISCIGFII